MRLIDADVLNEKLVQLARVMQDNGFHSYSSAVGEIINMVNQSKPIDGVPVVRCKDCTWFNCGYCMSFDDDVMPNDFCSRGHVET